MGCYKSVVDPRVTSWGAHFQPSLSKSGLETALDEGDRQRWTGCEPEEQSQNFKSVLFIMVLEGPCSRGWHAELIRWGAGENSAAPPLDQSILSFFSSVGVRIKGSSFLLIRHTLSISESWGPKQCWYGRVLIRHSTVAFTYSQQTLKITDPRIVSQAQWAEKHFHILEWSAHALYPIFMLTERSQ